MANPHNLMPGDTLYYRGSQSYHRHGEYVIEKVGREWAYPVGAQWRINLESLQAHVAGYGNVGRLYTSEEQWLAEQTLSAAWGKLRSDLQGHYTRPAHITLAQIEQARRILGMEEKEQQ